MTYFFVNVIIKQQLKQNNICCLQEQQNLQ
jgi:hypothetical protein